jgi:hypothetical protein
MNNSKFLAIGLVLGGVTGIIVGALVDNVPMGIVFGGGFGLILGLAIATVLDRRSEAVPFPDAGVEPAREDRATLSLSEDDIRALGFEWPKHALIEEYCVTEDRGIDLSRTIERLESSRAYYRGQLNEAFAFKQQTGADYADFTDRFDDNARMHRQLSQAVAYLEEIVAAAGKR